MEHEVNEAVLLDASIALTFASKGVEAVGHDSGQVDVLHKGHLVDSLLSNRLRLGRSESQVREHTAEVRSQLALDKFRINLRVKVLHIQQIDHLRLRRLGLDLKQLLR